nr:hypothetical protein [Synechococcus sp. HK05]
MRTTLELPDPLFARLKARAATERLTLKQLLRHFVEQGLNDRAAKPSERRSRATLPQIQGPLPIAADKLSNAGLFELLDS